MEYGRRITNYKICFNRYCKWNRFLIKIVSSYILKFILGENMNFANQSYPLFRTRAFSLIFVGNDSLSKKNHTTVVALHALIFNRKVRTTTGVKRIL